MHCFCQCLIWRGDLFNVKQLSSDGMIGNLWHLRVAASETMDQMIDSKDEKRKRKTTWIVVGVLAGLFTILNITVVFVRRRKSIYQSIGDV